MTKIALGRIIMKIIYILIIAVNLTNEQNLNPPKNTSSNIVTINQSLDLDNVNFTLYNCSLGLADNVTTDLLRQYFKTNTSGGLIYMIYFKLKYLNENGLTVPFDLSADDTFSPDLWVWAAGKGKNLLRLPLDHKILSFGLLSIQSANIEIKFDYLTYSCLKSIPVKIMLHMIGKYFSENITSNGTTVSQDTEGPIVCRSVYAFDHFLFGKKGIGFDCCAPGKVYICDKGYSEAYELIWYGPFVLMCLTYLIGIVHFYRLYKKSLNQIEVRQLSGLQKTIEEIKHDIVHRIVVNTEKWVRIQTPEALIALRERCGLLEILGVGKAKHSKIVSFFRLAFCIFIFVAYYGIWAILLRVYWEQLGEDLKRFTDSQTVYLNVIGHIGWVYCSKDLGIFSYAIFEAVYTGIVPILALFVYLSIRVKKKLAKTDDNDKHFQVKCLLFCESHCGKAMQFISILLLLLHFICLGGVFLSYVAYLVSLGIFANIDVVSPWIIPLTLCIHFFSTSFDPAYTRYKKVKEMLFSICFDDFKNLIIKQNKEIFLPRDLIENFYIPNSRNLIYSCFLKIFCVLTLMLLLVLVVLTLQYPYNTKLTSLVPFLGVQIIFVLPYLTKFMNVNNQTSPLEDTVLKRDLHDYLKEYIKQNPELKEASPNTESSAELLRSDNDNSSSNLMGDGGQDGGLGIEIDPEAVIATTREIAKRQKMI